MGLSNDIEIILIKEEEKFFRQTKADSPTRNALMIGTYGSLFGESLAMRLVALDESGLDFESDLKLQMEMLIEDILGKKSNIGKKLKVNKLN